MKIRTLLSGICALVLFTSCAKAPPRAATPGGERNAQAILVERALKEADSHVKTLKGLAEAVLIDKDESRRSDLAIVISRPGKIRADAVDTLADVWAAAGTDGKRLWLWLPQKEKLYRGAASARNLKKLAAFDWEISELSSIVSGLVPGARNAELDEVDGGKKAHYVFRDRPLHLYVDPKTKNPVRLIRYKEPENTVRYEVLFGDYRAVDGAVFPYSIEVTFPERDCSFYLHYKDVRLNAPVDSSLFKPEEVWRKQTVKIDKKE